MNTPHRSSLTFVKDPSRSGFFTESPGVPGLVFIEDPSPSGFFMQRVQRCGSPSTPSPSSVPAAALAGEEKISHPLLIQTYKSGHKRKIFRDRKGLYIVFRLNPADEEEWLRCRSRLLGGLPQGFLSTQTLNVKASITYEELKRKVDEDVPEQEDRFALIALSDRQSVEKIKLEGVAVIWQLPGGEKGYTMIEESNCRNTMELIANREWKDMLVAIYDNERR